MNKLLLALLSGLILAFSWPSIGVFPFIFFAFIPLFILEEKDKNKKEVFWYSYIAFLIFNVITTYWIYHASPFGAFAAFAINALLMAISFLLFHIIKKINSNSTAYLFFVFSWISMEYLHLNWDLSWPWLILGNVFAEFPSMVQWYEFTGFLGGSFWILIINILLFKLYKNYNKKKILLSSLFFFIPIVISFYIIWNFPDKNDNSVDVLIVQPNIDPYIDKFSKGYQQQINDFIALAKTQLSQKTQLLIGPETALLEGIWENKIEYTYSIMLFRELQKEFPNLNILIGATTYKMFASIEDRTNTARKIKHEDIYYDAYNSAIFISNSSDIKVYHKTKLVPGAEKMPFPTFLDPLAKLIIDLGGISGSLGSENSTNVFSFDDILISPLICYESVYGDMGLGKTNLLAIITNDGWWKNTPGYKQHLAYARLRAVEQRKSIVRSANTGISAIINSKGKILQKSNWDEEICIKTKVEINNQITFYSQFGDYLGRISVFIFFIFLIVNFVKSRLH